MRRNIYLLAIMAAMFLAFAPFAYGQKTLPNFDLPSHKKFQQASQDIRKIKTPVASQFHWSIDQSKLLFTLEKNRKQLDLKTGEISAAADEPEQPEAGQQPRRGRRGGVGRARQRTSITSPDGQWKAVYRDNNITLEKIGEGDQPSESTPVTTEGTDKHRFGTACWVYGEELSQNDAMWFSADSRKLVFYEFDEQHMKTYFLTTGNTGLYTELHKEQYPTAGEDNPHVKMHIYDIASKSTTQIKIDGPVDQYLYGIDFPPAGNEMIFHRTNRWQNKLDIMAADLDSGTTRVVLSEQQPTWQNNSPLMRFLSDGQRFIWETERTGWKQYELRHMQGHKINGLTPEVEYPVQRIVKLDEDQGWLYFTAFSGNSPLDVHLHRVRLDGSEHCKLTCEDLHYSAFNISDDHQWFVASYETIDTPPSFGLFDMQGQRVAVLSQGDKQALSKAGFTPSELFSFTAADGKTPIFGYLEKPRGFDPQKKYPLLINVYGGPSNSGVSNRFRRPNAYTELGFVIAKIANRGTNERGKAFASATYMALGKIDLDDQADGVKHLTQKPYIDGDRVGITGHSYGGYMSALAVLRYPDIFHVGVAGAPVTHWKNYDTIYTERYMRTPQENKAGYEFGSCLQYADNLTGKLFILHGLVDDNVHPSNTWQLVDALQKAEKRFDMMVYPNSAHGFRYNNLKWEYLVRHLAPEYVTAEETSEGTR